MAYEVDSDHVSNRDRIEQGRTVSNRDDRIEQGQVV